MYMDLTQQKCVPCEGGTKPFIQAEYKQYLSALSGWMVVADKQLEKDFKFKDFAEALAFVNQVGEIAEAEGHHPDIFLHNWKSVKISLMTHAIGGLSINDFILAAKIDQSLIHPKVSSMDPLIMLEEMLAIVGHPESERKQLAEDMLLVILRQAMNQLSTSLTPESQKKLNHYLTKNPGPGELLAYMKELTDEASVKKEMSLAGFMVMKTYLEKMQESLTPIQRDKLLKLFTRFS